MILSAFLRLDVLKVGGFQRQKVLVTVEKRYSAGGGGARLGQEDGKRETEILETERSALCTLICPAPILLPGDGGGQQRCRVGFKWRLWDHS